MTGGDAYKQKLLTDDALDAAIAAHCHDCGHRAIVSTEGLPADLPIPDIALRLVCSACQSRRIGVMLDMQAHYARLEAETGWKMEVKPWPEGWAKL